MLLVHSSQAKPGHSYTKSFKGSCLLCNESNQIINQECLSGCVVPTYILLTLKLNNQLSQDLTKFIVFYITICIDLS